MKTKTRIKRILALCLLLVVSLTMFSGCGFAGADHSNSKTKYGRGGGEDSGYRSNGNKLVMVWKDKITSMDGTEVDSSNHNGLWSVPLNVKHNYGIDSKDSISAPIRATAIMLLNSTFPGAYEGDEFSSEAYGEFTLSPSKIIQQVTDITSGLIGGEGMRGLTGAIKGMAAAILIAVWAMGFISQIVNEKFTMETLLKTLMQLMCGILLIENATVIVQAFAEAGSALVSEMNPGSEIDMFSALKNELVTSLKKDIPSINIGLSVGFIQLGVGSIWFDFAPIGVILMLAVPLFGQINCAFKIVSMLIMRTFELIARITFAPIPIAFSAQQGFSQEAIRYFRGILACAMQPALMLLGTSCLSTVADTVCGIFGRSGNLGGIAGSLALGLTYFVLAAYLGQTKQLAQDIIAR